MILEPVELISTIQPLDLKISMLGSPPWTVGSPGNEGTLHYLNKFIQAPRWRGITLGENNNVEFGVFNGSDELITNSFPFSDSLIVLVSMNSFVLKSMIKMINEARTSIFTPETQKYIILKALISEWSWRRRHLKVWLKDLIKIKSLLAKSMQSDCKETWMRWIE